MDYKRLGKSNLEISRIGFGCMSLKGNQKENEQLIDQAIKSGINYFDTADLYDKGMNEISVGEALKSKRKEVILATKVGNQWRPDGSGWDWNPHKDYIIKAVEKSLQRLQTDYIDLYQLHGGTIEDPIDETIEAFDQLVDEGKILYYGISSIRLNVIREWAKRSNIISVMMQYSLLDRRPEDIFLLLQEKQIGILARGSVAQGLLINKPLKSFLNYSEEEVQKARDSIKNLSDNKRSMAQTALQFVLSHPAITAAIVGIRSIEQLQDAIKSVNISQLKAEEIQMLASILPKNNYSEHL